MQFKIRFVFIALIIFLIGCQLSDNQINIYFDPSGASYLERISVKAKIDNQIILDTIVENTHINKSLLLKTFYHRISNKGLFSVEINGKYKEIKKINDFQTNCTDVFLGYDDHSLIFKEASKIVAKKEEKHIPVDYKQVFDSIRVSSFNKYDQIKSIIKQGECAIK